MESLSPDRLCDVRHRLVGPRLLRWLDASWISICSRSRCRLRRMLAQASVNRKARAYRDPISSCRTNISCLDEAIVSYLHHRTVRLMKEHHGGVQVISRWRRSPSHSRIHIVTRSAWAHRGEFSPLAALRMRGDEGRVRSCLERSVRTWAAVVPTPSF